jgi:streptomycin 6-kinase
VPAVVRNKAALAGADGWLRDLPDLVDTLAREWSITVGPAFDDSTEGLVAQVSFPDGTPAVLKVLIPRSYSPDAARHEITVLRLADGEGCARLLRADTDRGALLLERLGPSMHSLGLPIQARHEILCSCASRLWRRRPGPDCGLPTGADKARWLMSYITRTWAELGRPCSERAVTYALDCAARRLAAHDDSRAVLVHGDVHEWNALAAGAGFKLVDPDGLLAEPEYDLGVMMREDPHQLLSGDPLSRARWLASRCGLDATAIWEWGVVERVSTGLLCTGIGLQPVGRQMLAAADRVALSPWNSGPLSLSASLGGAEVWRYGQCSANDRRRRPVERDAPVDHGRRVDRRGGDPAADQPPDRHVPAAGLATVGRAVLSGTADDGQELRRARARVRALRERRPAGQRTGLPGGDP